jgi:sugar phosphate isomerase/epimerase
MATQIGAQMYTIRDFCKTSADIAASCAKLSKMGYRAVQASGIGAIEPKELRKILDDNGLVCAATHRSLDQMKDTAKIIDEHQTLGCKLTAIGGFGFGKSLTEAEWAAFAADYSELAKTLKAKGLAIGYHNHSHEWAPVGKNGQRSVIAMDVLLKACDPAVWFEIDTYWVAHGGGDPAQWIQNVKGRIPAVHFKDISITSDRQHKMVEVGSGNLNWPRILEACKAAGVEWYLVERDAGDLDPFESLKISYDAMRSWGLQ